MIRLSLGNKHALCGLFRSLKQLLCFQRAISLTQKPSLSALHFHKLHRVQQALVIWNLSTFETNTLVCWLPSHKHRYIYHNSASYLSSPLAAQEQNSIYGMLPCYTHSYVSLQHTFFLRLIFPTQNPYSTLPLDIYSKVCFSRSRALTSLCH